MTGAVFLGAGALCASVGLMATSAWLISRAAQHPSVQSLAVAVVGVRFFGIARGLLRYAERLVGHDAALRVLADLRVDIYRRLERLAPAGLPAFRSGDLLARLVGDVDAQQDLLLRVLAPYAVAVVTGVAVVALTASIDLAVGVLLGVTLLLAAALAPRVSRRIAQRTEARQATARGDLSQAVVDLLQGAPDLVAYGAARAQLAKVAEIDAELTAVERAAARSAGVGAAITAVLTGVAVWGAVVLGLEAVHAGRLDGVLLAVVVLVPLAAFETVAGLPAAAQSYERGRGSSARVYEVRSALAPVVDPPTPLPLTVGESALVLRGVRAQWPSAARDGDRNRGIDGVDLELPPGRRVAVVGSSGAGKSTLAAVLLRFLSYEGSVELDGVELDRLGGADVRTRIGLAAQDAHVFDTTLAENLRLARPAASDDELWDVLRRARLSTWVSSLPDGLDTAVGQRGTNLSGGQRQRLSLARALLADFPVLVLDEPGEHLDTGAADELTADLLEATRGRTTVLITHRLNGLSAVDEVLVLDEGRVVERGTHEELVALDGRYRALWEHELAAARQVG